MRDFEGHGQGGGFYPQCEAAPRQAVSQGLRGQSGHSEMNRIPDIPSQQGLRVTLILFLFTQRAQKTHTTVRNSRLRAGAQGSQHLVQGLLPAVISLVELNWEEMSH